MTRRGAAGAFLAFGAAALAGCVTEDDAANTAAVEQALSGSDVAWVDTVLGMATLPARNGDLATTTAAALGATVALAKGCVTVGDGGGGLFYWDASSGTDDGGTVIVPGGTTGSTGACWRRVIETTNVFDVKDFGARGDGSTDDRLAIQAAIGAASAAGGGVVHIGRGTFRVTKTPGGGNDFCLLVPSGVSIVGAGRATTILQQAPSIAPSVRLLYLTGADIRLADLTLDGFKGAPQSASEHRHGIFAEQTDRLVVERVNSQNFTGDGFYLYAGARNSSFHDVTATGNNRNGLTMGAQVDGVVVMSSRFVGNAAQQLDSEAPGFTVNDVTINGCLLDGAGVTGGYALTISGSSSSNRSRNWTVTGNVIHGGINVVWADDVTISGNTGINPTTARCVRVYRRCCNVTISNNNVRMTQTTTAEVPAIDVTGTGTDHMPERIIVANNTVQVANASSWGIRVQGALSVSITGNVARGSGVAAAGYSGIYVRATHLTIPFRSAIIRENTISNFGESGIGIGGNMTAQLLVVDISANVFDDDSAVATMTRGISIDASGAVQQQKIVDNSIIGGVTTMGP